ncbi:MAG: phytanoyl-CoA dioxygenase family protein [Cyanobacteria bacterium P01_E01_bin.42]
MTSNATVNSWQPPFDWKYSLGLALTYILAKLKFLHGFLPEKLKKELPIGWNAKMFWTAFTSGGQRVYYDYYCRFKDPKSYQPKASVSPEFQLSEADIRSFYEKGYIGPFDLIPAEEMAELKTYLVDSLIKTESQIWSASAGDFEFEEEGTETPEKRAYYTKLLNQLNRHLEAPEFVDLFKHPAVTERCAQLLGPDLILWRTKFFGLPPQSKGTTIHQASTWLYENKREAAVIPQDEEELFQLACWIALTDATQENGCMIAYPGTHKEIYPIKLGQKTSNTVYGSREATIDYPGQLPEPELIEVKAGQFFFFSERVIHGSLDNISLDKERWGVNGRIATTATQIYTKEMLENSHTSKDFKLKNLSLDKWKAILIRGEDRFGYNRYSTKS